MSSQFSSSTTHFAENSGSLFDSPLPQWTSVMIYASKRMKRGKEKGHKSRLPWNELLASLKGRSSESEAHQTKKSCSLEQAKLRCNSQKVRLQWNQKGCVETLLIPEYSSDRDRLQPTPEAKVLQCVNVTHDKLEFWLLGSDPSGSYGNNSTHSMNFGTSSACMKAKRTPFLVLWITCGTSLPDSSCPRPNSVLVSGSLQAEHLYDIPKTLAKL